MAQVAQKQREVVEALDKTASKNFVKRMLALGVSNIVYLRNIFPEDAFADRKIEDLRLKILKENGHDGAARIVQWMKGVYDALDNEYLRALVFAIVSDKENPESVVESYTFCFTYENGAVQASMSTSTDSIKSTIPTKDETLESAKKFLRNLFLLTSTMENLPPNVFMTVRLLYYDTVTPSKYQPPGFIEAVEKDALGFADDNIRLKLGHIVTPHTCMKVRVRAPKRQFDAPEKSMSTEIEIADSQMTIDSAGDSKVATERQRHLSSEIGPKGDCKTKPEIEEATREEVEDDFGVRCPCLDPADDGIMILCSICSYWQHAICFCLYDETNMPDKHICHLCSDKHTRICSDPRLTGLHPEQQQEICGWRRTLLSCLDKTSVTLSEITTQLSSSKALAQKMLSRLIEEKIVVPVTKGNKSNKKINHDRLKTIFKRDVTHIGDNLRLQRNDKEESMYLDEEESSVASTSPLQRGKRKASVAETHKQVLGRRLRSSPVNSQSSAYVFRADSMEQPQATARSRKRRRLSKSETMSGQKQ